MLKILCVEDEADLREDLLEELEEDGFEVASASNGVEGLRVLAAFEPDLVISDCLMPMMTGVDMFKEIRAKHPRFADVPFIFLSAHAQREHVEQGMDLGADGYITKPVDYGELLNVITTLLTARGLALPGRCRGTGALDPKAKEVK